MTVVTVVPVVQAVTLVTLGMLWSRYVVAFFTDRLNLIDLAGSERQTFDPLHPAVVLTPC